MTYHLEASVDLARMVEQAGGHTDMAALASVLSYSGVRNGAFLTRLANARLFGLVAGRSGEVTLLDRGRRCLSPDPAEAREARVEACLAVPLFRHVLERLSAEVVPPPEALAGLLRAGVRRGSGQGALRRPRRSSTPPGRRASSPTGAR